MNIKGNIEDVAIVVVGYNRIHSIRRLLNSLSAAYYPSCNIPLVISIDASGDTELYEYVQGYYWPHGPKYVNIQEERLGLMAHIYQCGELSELFRAVIILEDDLIVSPYFYSYVLNALENYSGEERIAEISLYKNEVNGYVGLPFSNEHRGNDVFLMQDVSTWGECFTSRMWRSFKQWRDSHTEEYIQQIDMPSQIKKWTRAWSKYYNAYVVDTGRYVLYPEVSLTTNYSDAGEHGEADVAIVQVNLQQGDFNYRMGEFDSLVRYDIYFNNEALYEWLGLTRYQVRLDVYGFETNPITDCRYILSSRILPYEAVRSFGLNLRPLELNVRDMVSGESLVLYDTKLSFPASTRNYNMNVVQYFLQGFNVRLLMKYVISYISRALLRKLGMRR